MKWNCLFTLALVLVLSASVSGQPLPAFSLDDDPTNPLTSPTYPGAVGIGAEDPFGITGNPALAPSPSLNAPSGPFVDADILRPGMAAAFPAMHVASPGPGYIDAISRNNYHLTDPHICFSVDRISTGALVGAALPNDLVAQAAANQAPGDVYRALVNSPHPALYVGTLPAGAGYVGRITPVPANPGRNKLLYDESTLTLTVTGTPGNLVGPGVIVNPPTPGSHDNVDALDLRFLDDGNDQITDHWMYFSINPDEANDVNASGPAIPVSAADIFAVPPGSAGIPPVAWARAPTMGLDVVGDLNSDDIDGLVVWDVGQYQGDQVEREVDFALFSLSLGSSSLGQWNLSPADVFFTDFNGSFGLFASASDLGAAFDDNVDALDVLLPGDASVNERITVGDVSLLADHWGKPADWFGGDFTGDDQVTIGDVSILSAWWGCGEPLPPPPLADVPEPASLTLLAAGAAVLLRRRRT